MRKYLFLTGLVVVFGLFSCNNTESNTGGEYNIDNPANADDPEANGDGLPTIDFAETEYNFGTVIQGEKVSHTFVLTNNGDGNLIISNVKASCGCTATEWTKEPVKPGKTGNVEVVFDSSNREGKQTKTVKVYSNTNPNFTELVIRCEVIK